MPAGLGRAWRVVVLSLMLGVRIADAQPASGSTAPSEPFDIRRIDPETFRAVALRIPEGQAPRVDGRLDDAIWAQAPVQGHFIQREPQFGQPARQQTEFRILYDDRKIYFGVWLWDDDPTGIIGNEMKRDSGLRRGDQLKITIDTFHDHRNAFYFSTNPLGALKDAHTVENGRTINYDFNVVYENRTSRDARGWYVEIAVPLSQLRFPTRLDEAVWGLNLCRVVMRSNEESYWVPFPREWGAGGFARVSNAGVLGGLRGIRSRRRVEFLPFVVPKATRDFDRGTPTARNAGTGFDFKLGLTNDLTADLTYHTDFAQVEADQEVVNLTRFSLFFPERRQFFTESAGIFDYGRSGSSPGGDASINDPGILPLFYSRRIGLEEGQEVPIIGGGKVTGRLGPWALGVLTMATDAKTIRTPSGEAFVPQATFTALRVKRNVLKASSIGGILLNREGGRTAYNRAFGLDAGLLLGRAVTITGLLAKTDSPDAAGRDMAGVVDVIYKTDRFNYGLQYMDIGEKFDAQMGFVVRTDIRAAKAKAAWTPRPRWRGVRQLFVNGTADYYEDHRGLVSSRTQAVELQMQRQDTSSWRVSATHDYDYLPAPFATGGTVLPVGAYDYTNYALSYTSNQARRMYGSFTAEAGTYYSGERQAMRVSWNVQAGRALLLEPNYTRNRITLPGRPTFVANTLNVRLSQSFSPNLYLKGFYQYNDAVRTANINVLLWYIYKPGSDFYLVFNQGYETDRPEHLDPRVRNRSVTMKVTYWLAR